MKLRMLTPLVRITVLAAALVGILVKAITSDQRRIEWTKTVQVSNRHGITGMDKETAVRSRMFAAAVITGELAAQIGAGQGAQINESVSTAP